MKEKREKTIRDYLYEEESNKTLTAKDIVSRIDFSTPQVKPQVRRKKKSKLKVALVCLSYIFIAFFTSIITYSVVIDKNNEIDKENYGTLELVLYSQSYFKNNNIINIFYKETNNGKINNLYGEKTLIENYKPYNSIYFGEETIDIVYEIKDEEMVFYIINSSINKNIELESFIISYDDKEIIVNANEVTYFATLKENEELEFDILYNGEQRHCIIQNLN